MAVMYYFYFNDRRPHWRNTFVLWFWVTTSMWNDECRPPRRFASVGRSWDRDEHLYVILPLAPIVMAARWWLRWRWVLEHALMYAGVLTHPSNCEYRRARIPELVPDHERKEHRVFDWRRREFRRLDGLWMQRLPDGMGWWDGMRVFWE